VFYQPCGKKEETYFYGVSSILMTFLIESIQYSKEVNMTNIASHPVKSTLQVGFFSAILTALMTAVTFGFAIMAIPISGANCMENCIEYPYLNTIGQFPKDFQWMIPAIVMLLVYLVFMVSIQSYAAPEKKIFGQVSMAFAVISTMLLVADYFIQFSVVPVSLMNGELEGIPLIIQYNSHGPFIVVEELGYLLMSLSFFFAAFVFDPKSRLEAAIRWIFIAGFVLTMLAFGIVNADLGLERRDRFEVIVISITWLVLIVNGILAGILFKKRMRD
jgi:membrane protein CcdC involved in cytochrome C biogenesis